MSDKRIKIYTGESRYGGRIDAYMYVCDGNSKTGRVAGLAIVPEGSTDFYAIVRQGLDGASCGGCGQRSIASGGNGECYVNGGSMVGNGLTSMLRAAHAEGLDVVPDVYGAVSAFLCDKRGKVRFAAFRSAVYGDAAALPVHVWQSIEHACKVLGVPVLGYTHGWTVLALSELTHLRATHVLSVDDTMPVAMRLHARGMGWRAFRILDAVKGTAALERGAEILCPASKERGSVTTCVKCLSCGTVGNERGTRDVAIVDHGKSAKRKRREAAKAAQVH